MSPGFFFFLPSPKLLCPELLAVAIPLGWVWLMICLRVLSLSAPGGPQNQLVALLLLHADASSSHASLKALPSRAQGIMGPQGVLVLAVVQAFISSSGCVSHRRPPASASA